MNTTDAFGKDFGFPDFEFSPEMGVYMRRRWGGGAPVDLLALTFGRGALQRGRPGGFYTDTWTYPSVLAAYGALSAWDGEGDPPDGWVRHTPSNRRRPNGSPTEEYVEP